MTSEDEIIGEFFTGGFNLAGSETNLYDRRIVKARVGNF
jgi:hypothetical protein